MVRGLAEDLLLLCWDDQQGAEHRFCWKTVDIGVAGALVAEARLSRTLAVEASADHARAFLGAGAG